jgi:3-hydroxyacyl-[acyl-carrier-protein] dehydratase
MPFKFQQIDKVLEFSAWQRIVAERTLRADEEYLKDHFPQWPVMPGVLMLECMFQAARWLVLASDEFKQPLVYLKETRNVKFTDFVVPGHKLVVTCEVTKREEQYTHFKVLAEVDGSTAVSGKLIAESCTVLSLAPQRVQADDYMRGELIKYWREIAPSTAVA